MVVAGHGVAGDAGRPSRAETAARKPTASSAEFTVSVMRRDSKVEGKPACSACSFSTMSVRPSSSRKVQMGSRPGGTCPSATQQ